MKEESHKIVKILKDINSKVIIQTKVLIQILELNINHLTPIVAFLLVKKIKNTLKNIETQYPQVLTVLKQIETTTIETSQTLSEES